MMSNCVVRSLMVGYGVGRSVMVNYTMVQILMVQILMVHCRVMRGLVLSFCMMGSFVVNS